MADFDPTELPQIQNYLEHKFKNKGFALKLRDRAKDSAELMLNGEFIALIYKNDDEGETSYDMNMSILDIDLQDVS